MELKDSAQFQRQTNGPWSLLAEHCQMEDQNCQAIKIRIIMELVGLTQISNSQESGEVPPDWKLASAIPIYKKGMRKDPENYRPASLTAVPGKIMEKTVLGDMERHLKNKAGIRHSHHGFIKGKSRLRNLILFHDKVTCLVEEGKAVALTFLDFSKAFDTIPHDILLSTCEMNGSHYAG